MTPEQFAQLLRSLHETKTTEIITSAILILTFLIAIGSLLYARYQFLAARETMLGDQRRSQRQLAMEMCIKWSEFTSPETSSVTRLIERLTQDQCDAIANSTQLIISVQYELHLINILQFRFRDIESVLKTIKKDTVFELDGKYVIYIRHIAVRYLNMLESILLAWSMGIADGDIIEKEFSYLFNESQRRTAMENLRKQLGMDGFPGINQFMMTLRSRIMGGDDLVRRKPIV